VLWFQGCQAQVIRILLRQTLNFLGPRMVIRFSIHICVYFPNAHQLPGTALGAGNAIMDEDVVITLEVLTGKEGMSKA